MANFVIQSAFMKSFDKPIDQLNEIKTMMERSSRFISLSGWSGISAGVCALIGAYIAHIRIENYYLHEYKMGDTGPSDLFSYLIGLALLIFVSALCSAFLFTYRKSKKDGTPIWGISAQRLMWNTMLPMLVGGVFILALIQDNQYQFVSSACLLFYGLGLVNGSKFTLGEIRFLGYAELVLGLLNLFFVRYSLLIWTIGFGLMHIMYGLAMWFKYERNSSNE